MAVGSVTERVHQWTHHCGSRTEVDLGSSSLEENRYLDADNSKHLSAHSKGGELSFYLGKQSPFQVDSRAYSDSFLHRGCRIAGSEWVVDKTNSQAAERHDEAL